jgi:hypothetical protein
MTLACPATLNLHFTLSLPYHAASYCIGPSILNQDFFLLSVAALTLSIIPFPDAPDEYDSIAILFNPKARLESAEEIAISASCSAGFDLWHNPQNRNSVF